MLGVLGPQGTAVHQGEDAPAEVLALVPGVVLRSRCRAPPSSQRSARRQGCGPTSGGCSAIALRRNGASCPGWRGQSPRRRSRARRSVRSVPGRGRRSSLLPAWQPFTVAWSAGSWRQYGSPTSITPPGCRLWRRNSTVPDRPPASGFRSRPAAAPRTLVRRVRANPACPALPKRRS